VDQTNRPDSLNQIYRLLALCARAEGHPVFYRQLALQLDGFTAWQELPAQAEAHGMAPLLRYHILQAGLSIPAETQQTLMGLYLRHRAFNRAHAQSLAEIVQLLDQSGIQPVLLKGLGLAYQYYPDPALRPATDIDLLVQKNEIAQVQHLLTTAGYSPTFSAQSGWVSKEMTANSPTQGGISTRVEIHHYDPASQIYDDLSPDHEFAGFDLPPVTISIEGQIISIPAPTDNLRYLSRHLVHHLPNATTANPLQLKWSADIISLVEKQAESIDWEFIQQRDPATLVRLEVLYSLTPLPLHCVKIVPVRQSSPPDGLNQYPTGWPKQAFRQTKRGDLWQFISQTFNPPTEWWLRLYFGTRQPSLFWHARVVYPLRILKMIFWALVRQINNWG
jgi:hypothetical protein